MSYKVSTYPVEALDAHAEIQPGFAFKSGRFTDSPDDTPLVKGENLHQGYIDWIGAKCWPADEYETHAKYHLAPGDIVLAMDRPWVTAGLKWSYIRAHDPKALLVQRVARIRARGKLSQDYLRHVISSSYFANYLRPIVTGVNVPHISGKQIGAFQIPIPKPEVQESIAAILSAYDDLVEAKKRRAVLLERLAEELYREWFIRMRFPGHQRADFVKGIPANWTIRELGSLVSDIIDYRGLTPAKLGGSWSEDGVPALSALNVKSGELVRLGEAKRVSEQLYERWMRKELQAHDILLTSEAPLGQTYFLVEQQRYVLSQRLFAVRANPAEVSPAYLFQYLRYPIGQGQLTSRATGATVGGIRQSLLRRVEVIVPCEKLIRAHDKRIQPILKELHILRKQIRIAGKTRDLLLPRLISGKFSVDELDIKYPPSMQSEAGDPETAHA